MSESRIVCDYPYPVITVWRALTDPALVALWTSTGQGGRPEGFKTEVGTKFRYIGKPFPGWDGIVRCEVLAVDEPALLRYDWRNKETDQPTMVTNILAEIPGGTRLTWEHTGFHGIEGAFMSRLLGRVRRKMLTEGLPPVLADIGDDGRLRPGSTLSGPGQRVAPGRLISANLASGFHRCWPPRAGTRDLFALMQVRGTCHASSGGSGMAARNRVIAGPVGAVPADGCGLSDLLDPAYAIGERDREPLDLAEGWARRWVTRWQAGKSAVSCPVREMGEVLVSGCRPVRRFSWSTAQRHRPGLAAVVSTGRLHGFESLAEQRLLLALDFLGVVDLLAQPMALKFTTSSGGTSEHVPDLLAVTRDGVLLIDVRPADRIAPADRVKFAATEEAALSCGWGYLVVAGWRAQVQASLDALSAQRRPLSDPLGLQEQLLDTVRGGELPFGDLVRRTDYPVIGRAHAIHLLCTAGSGWTLRGRYS